MYETQTNRRKNPVLMRFSRIHDDFHEKMTFSSRFGHACCIHLSSVGNGTGRKQVFRDENKQRFNTHQGRFKILKVTFLRSFNVFENSIEVVSLGTVRL
ncbi:hypothetical protein JWR97_12765 [Pseudomonas cedrina subsp. fulgida]|nr:hypothetical protein [Pseudomonas cedrina subsp. fulgida]